MTINILLEDNNPLATVSLSQNNRVENKKIPLAILFESFNQLISAEKDTGFLSSNLLRETVKTTVCRAFYFKEFITDFKYSKRSSVDIKTSNKYGITFRNGLFVIPNFKFKNVLGFITNSNTETFNPSFYQIYSVLPTLLGDVAADSKLVRLFPNQFSDKICWPDNFDKTILSSRDLKRQSTFISQYLTSKFNTDLFEARINPSKLSSFSTELDAFFQEVFGRDSSSIRESDGVLWFYMIYFFLATIKNVEPAAYADSDNGMTIGNLFNSKM